MAASARERIRERLWERGHLGGPQEGVVPGGYRLPFLWPGLEGVGCVFTVFWLYGLICMGKAHCILVKGFTGGSELVPQVRAWW